MPSTGAQLPSLQMSLVWSAALSHPSQGFSWLGSTEGAISSVGATGIGSGVMIGCQVGFGGRVGFTVGVAVGLMKKLQKGFHHGHGAAVGVGLGVGVNVSIIVGRGVGLGVGATVGVVVGIGTQFLGPPQGIKQGGLPKVHAGHTLQTCPCWQSLFFWHASFVDCMHARVLPSQPLAQLVRE